MHLLLNFSDKEYLYSVTYLRSAAALSYFGELPSTWSDRIFNVEFLEQLDKECNRSDVVSKASAKFYSVSYLLYTIPIPTVFLPFVSGRMVE